MGYRMLGMPWGILGSTLGNRLLSSNQKLFDWYVDSVNGNDANDGKSPINAFSTIAKLLTVLLAGESVGLARGSSWREMLTVPGDACGVYAYGTGDKPILDCSDVAANASFSKTGGRTNVYEISVTPGWGTSNFLNVWEDDVFLTLAADLATCDATPGSYFPSAATGTITLYVHASDSSDVTANGKVYTYSQRQFGIEGYNYSNCVISGIRAQKNLGENGSVKTGQYATLIDCDFYYGNKHNVYVRLGSNLNGCTARHAYYGGAGFAMFILNDNTPNGENTTYTNCTAQMDTYDANASGFDGHQNTSGAFGTVTYSGCVGINLKVAFQMEEAAAMVIEDCTITDCNQLCRQDALPVTITDTTVIGGSGSPQNLIAPQSGTSPIIVDGLDLSQADANGLIVLFSTLAQAITIVNCNFTLNSTTGVTRILFLTNAGATVSFTYNTIPVSGWTSCLYLEALPLLNILSDYNAFGDNSPGQLRANGVNYGSDVAAWKAGTGQDANSTVGA